MKNSKSNFAFSPVNGIHTNIFLWLCVLPIPQRHSDAVWSTSCSITHFAKDTLLGDKGKGAQNFVYLWWQAYNNYADRFQDYTGRAENQNRNVAEDSLNRIGCNQKAIIYTKRSNNGYFWLDLLTHKLYTVSSSSGLTGRVV